MKSRFRCKKLLIYASTLFTCKHELSDIRCGIESTPSLNGNWIFCRVTYFVNLSCAKSRSYAPRQKRKAQANESRKIFGYYVPQRPSRFSLSVINSLNFRTSFIFGSKKDFGKGKAFLGSHTELSIFSMAKYTSADAKRGSKGAFYRLVSIISIIWDFVWCFRSFYT